jgi:pyruvate dehydrogenase E1 component alpha subunit
LTKVNKINEKEKYLRFYKQMVLIRKFEEKAGQLYGMGKIAGFCHLYIGQEAVVVGFISSSKPGDKMITSYRDHGHMLAIGTDPKIIMAELMGRATGCSKGKGGSMHMFDLERHFYGGHGIVGAQVPIGTGLAFADKYLKRNNITYVYYGDGAAHQGQVYESFNMAALWQLPVIYIVENNGYAMGTSVSRSTHITDLYKRSEGFGIPSVQVDGMDIFAMENAANEAAKFVRNGKGPILIEVKTYRYRGHSMSDPAKYRSKEEVQGKRENHDPIANLKKHLLDNKIVKEEELDLIDDEVKNKVNEAIEFAENSPEPNESELYTDIN